MRAIQIQLVGQSAIRWAEELRHLTSDIKDFGIEISAERSWSHESEADILAFEDEAALKLSVGNLNRKTKAVFLVTSDPNRIPDSWSKSLIDDVLCFPFRKLEVISKIKRFVDLLKWEEVEKLNLSYKKLIEELKNDLDLATRLQKHQTPNRFVDLKGLQVSSRYLAGMKGGADYFDLAETKGQEGMSLILSHSSSYGLSSQVMGLLLKVANKWCTTQDFSVTTHLRQIYDEIILTLGDKDELSLLHGWISRRDLKFKMVSFGKAHTFYSEKDEEFRELPKQGPGLNKTSQWPVVDEMEIQFSPDDRMVFLSHGAVTAVGGVGKVLSLLNQTREKDVKDAANEITLHVKKGLATMDDFPEQDCTIVVFDVDTRVIRLARNH
ncbi:MAG: hypothetical protein KA715_07045 [Xanthomonadaceae bacterium]|nr:hypothetical protein [Xanthomonadaceae bacterium]